MNIPSRIRIKRNVTYDVVFQDEIRSDPNCLGLCDPNTKTIFLKTNQSNTEMIKTFIHEFCHAADMEHDLGIKHKSIYKLEGVILQILKLNKFI